MKLASKVSFFWPRFELAFYPSNAAALSLTLSFAVCAMVLAGSMLPVFWSSNEINYFDLSYRLVRPDAFGEYHAAFDSSRARFASYWIIGSAIDLMGYEVSKVFFGALCLVLYAAVLAFLAKSFQLGPLAIGLVLLAFLVRQSLLGGEWLFGTTEAKVFAYLCVLSALGASLSGLWTLGLLIAALGAAFHFLVGGFWGLSLVALHALVARNPKKSFRLLVLFLLAIAPVLAVLSAERFGTVVDMTGVDMSLASIYAELRNPHHVAPFAGGLEGFASSFLPGTLVHGACALAFLLLRRRFGDQAPVALWLSFLNIYMVAAVVLAFLDRTTHLFAPLYLLRPSALVWFLSLVMFMRLFVCLAPERVLRLISLPAIALLGCLSFADVVWRISVIAAAGPIDRRVEATMSATQRDALDWLKENTTDDSVVLVRPSPEGLAEGNAFPAALERLTPAAYYVNFKWVPTAPGDLAEWYRRLSERRSVFGGDCGLLQEISIDYIVVDSAFDERVLLSCIDVVHTNADYSIYRVTGPVGQ